MPRPFTTCTRGLRLLKRGESQPTPVASGRNDSLVEQLEEFAAAVRGRGSIEVGGDYATRSLAVIRAGILSVQQGRQIEVAEVLHGTAGD